MNDRIFEYLKGTRLHRYLENNDTLNLYPSLRNSIYNTKISSVDVFSYPKYQFICHSMCNTMDIKFSVRDEFLSVIYDIIYDHKLSFMIHEIINIVIENGDIMDNEYIIIFLLAVKNDDYTSVDLILSNDFDMNIIGNGRRGMTRDNIITLAYKMSKNECMIRYLLSNGGDINDEYCNIGEYACSKGDMNFVNYLLDLDISDDRVFWMFISSVKHKNFIIASKIINYGFKIEDKWEEILNSHQCYTNIESVKCLIQHGLNINKYGSRLLITACSQNNYKLIDFYLKNNLIPDKKVLDVVFESGEPNIIEIFAINYIDLSDVKFGYTTHDALIESLKNNGLDMISFLKFFLRYIENLKQTISNKSDAYKKMK